MLTAGVVFHLIRLATGVHVHRKDWFLRSLVLFIALSVGAIAVRPYIEPQVRASADAMRFDHVTVISATFLYQGSQGVLALDKRNGNVWFFPRGQEMTLSFKDPQFVVRLPFEKLDQAPR